MWLAAGECCSLRALPCMRVLDLGQETNRPGPFLSRAQRQRANEKLADAEVAAAERMLRAAEIEYEAAQRAKRELAAAATAVSVTTTLD